jgi:thiamine phosphate synthase YjbQ (UPF0047 family)
MATGTQSLRFSTRGDGDVVDITVEVARCVEQARVRDRIAPKDQEGRQ